MKILLPLFLSLLAMAACTSEYDKLLNEASRAGKPGEGTFYATIEDTGSADPKTKVYADEQMRVLWNAGDTISIFKKTTLNRPYRFTGPEGSNAGGFTELPNSDEFITENPLNYNYAIYPYRKETVMSYDGVLTVDMPEVQVYKEHSFGMGANTMVSVTEDNILQFKNAGGYLSFKFYGDGVSVNSITLKGNNHEKLAGAAKVTMSPGGLPVVTMQSTATEGITLFCAEPVALGVDSEHYTEFWFVVPPTEFTKGFTVTVTDRRGGIFTTSTTSAVSVARNTLSRMAPMEVAPEYQYVPFDDANFKAYCVSNFDRNSDGEISMEEANNITKIDVRTTDIASLDGIEFMPNLYYLSCHGQTDNNTGKLTNFDVSKNGALRELYCYYNQLENLDVSKNMALRVLYCNGNQLENLDVSNNTTLTNLDCSYNQLMGLDVSKSTSLAGLDCSHNQLISLNVSQNTLLSGLYCHNNQLTSLDVSKNTALQSLYCNNNQLIRLNVSQNTLLSGLYCNNNQLTSLDVSQNTVLSRLYCHNNLLTNLDVSNNSVLSKVDCRENASTLVITVRSGQIFRDFSHDKTASIVETGDPIPQGNVTFKDLSFKEYCVNEFDVNKDDEISYAEALLITDVRCDNQNMSSLSGIELFPNLRSLLCYNNQLTSLDVSKNTALQYLYCNNNQLTSLDVSKNTALQSLYCNNNQLTSLDVSQNTALGGLRCYNNQLTSLDVSKNTALTVLYCYNNPNLAEIWLKTNQTIPDISYDSNFTTIKYKD